MSPDLRLATIYVMPLGGKDMRPVLAALEANKRYIRGEVAHAVNLKFAPDVRFRPTRPSTKRCASTGCWRATRCARISINDEERTPQEGQSDQRLAGAGQARRHDLDARPSAPCAGPSTRARPGTPAPSIPLATGVLPIALGEATKTVPYAVDGEKRYRFTVRWGAETDTDDARRTGRRARSELRREPAAIEALLAAVHRRDHADAAGLLGHQDRRQPRLRSGARGRGRGARAAARAIRRPATARDARTPTRAVFEARCGKGTYVRALARDMGRALGCLGHLIALRRTRVARFARSTARSAWRTSTGRCEEGEGALHAPAVADRGGAARSCRAQRRPERRRAPACAASRC